MEHDEDTLVNIFVWEPDDVVSRLVSQDIIDPKDYSKALYLSVGAADDKPKTVKELIKRGADVNWIYRGFFPKGQTPLLRVLDSTRPNFQIAKMLIEAGANVNFRDDNGRTILFNIVKDSSYHDLTIKSLRFLIDAGADMYAEDIDGLTPLTIAAPPIIKFLLDSGVNINATNSQGETPLEVVVRTARLDAMRILIDAGAEINIDKLRQAIKKIPRSVDQSTRQFLKSWVENPIIEQLAHHRLKSDVRDYRQHLRFAQQSSKRPDARGGGGGFSGGSSKKSLLRRKSTTPAVKPEQYEHKHAVANYVHHNLNRDLFNQLLLMAGMPSIGGGVAKKISKRLPSLSSQQKRRDSS